MTLDNCSEDDITEPWMGGSVGWSAAPIHQDCSFDPHQGTCKNQPMNAQITDTANPCLSLSNQSIKKKDDNRMTEWATGV